MNIRTRLNVDVAPDGETFLFEIEGAAVAGEAAEFGMTREDARGLRDRLDELLGD